MYAVRKVVVLLKRMFASTSMTVSADMVKAQKKLFVIMSTMSSVVMNQQWREVPVPLCARYVLLRKKIHKKKNSFGTARYIISFMIRQEI